MHPLKPSPKWLFGMILITPFVLSQLAASLPVELRGGDLNNQAYWLERKQWFYRYTQFELTDDNLKLLGPKRLNFENKSMRPLAHLPFWFDYQLFKKVFHKQSGGAEDELKRQQEYINTCVRALKARVLYRMLAGTSDTNITSDADEFQWEKYGPFGHSSKSESADDAKDMSFLVSFKVEPPLSNETPLDRAIRLVRQEMQKVESKNQVETYLKAFNEVDGSAIDGKLPY